MVLILSILVIFNTGCFENDSVKRFTALEIIERAEAKLNEYNITGDFKIIQFILYDESGRGIHGKYPEWLVEFINIQEPYNDTTHIMILYEYGEYRNKVWRAGYNNNSRPIINTPKIKLDSIEAYDIAVKEPEIKSFIKNHKNVHEDGINIYADTDDGTVYYSLSWAYESGNEEPGIAIYIDATNGEVLKIFTT